MSSMIGASERVNARSMQESDQQSKTVDQTESTTSFNNKSSIQNQAAYQTNYGHIFHGPVHILHGNDQHDHSEIREDLSVLNGLKKFHDETVTVKGPQADLNPEPNRYTGLSVTDELKLLRSLRFDQIDTRHATIRPAHLKTCEWLLRRKEYLDWLAPDLTNEHHGFLWIKGKPAAGKSTIMKHVFNLMKRDKGNARIISFFFSARGVDLERTSEGMYRSLLSQLFETIPDLQHVLYSHSILKNASGDIIWTLENLKLLFSNTIKALGNRPIIMFVDALDECDEDQVQEIVSYFEYLCAIGAEPDSPLNIRICFSSRHYPYITIEKSISLILEDQQEHQNDIRKYLSSELKIGASEMALEIRADILRRASGIFLWVALVVQMLNKEYRHGRIHALKQRLDEIPDGLDELFDDIITRDGHPDPEFILCLQWVLFATDLTPKELYTGILLETDPGFMPVWEPKRVTDDDISRFILSSSKGLVEETKGSRPTVQVIHESVRDFFLKEKGSKREYLGPVATLRARSHEKLKLLCCKYVKMPQVRNFVKSGTSSLLFNASIDVISVRTQLRQMFPLLKYAVANVLRHSEFADELRCYQDNFISNFPVRLWAGLYNILAVSTGRFYSSNVTLSYVFAAENLWSLLELELSRVGISSVQNEQDSTLLQAAAVAGSTNALRTILYYEYLGEHRSKMSPSGIERYETHLEQTIKWLVKNAFSFRYNSPISMAMSQGRYRVLNCLILSKALPLDPTGSEARQALWLLSCSGYSLGAQVLRDAGVVTDLLSIDTDGNLSTKSSTLSGHPEPSKTLSSTVAASGDTKMVAVRSALYEAAKLGYDNLVKEIPNAGTDVHTHGGEAIRAAAGAGEKNVVRALLEARVKIGLRGRDLDAALDAAVAHGHDSTAQILRKAGARVPQVSANVYVVKSSHRCSIETGCG